MDAWDTEPDFHSFEAAGLRCMMRRDTEWKHWCGYVGVGSAHPLFEVHYRDLVPAPGTWKKRGVDVDEHGVINVFITALEMDDIPEGFAPLTQLLTCHGGLSFAGRMYDWTGWWFGFDCNHAWDYSPGMEAQLLSAGIFRNVPERFMPRKVYRTFDYVKSEVATLAQQIADYGNDGSADAARDLIVALKRARSE